MNIDDRISSLFVRNIHTIKFDLQPMTALMGLLGHPEHRYPCIHVAGTNGKGSVCAMLAAILQSQGYRVGLYTSPHLVRFHERIKVDGKEIDDESLQCLMDEVELAAKQLPDLGHRDVTFFEFATALAFLHFARREVQIAVIETGMGGRLDATNIVQPELSIITSIGLEHQYYLGNTLVKIAAEKAGIIKQGRPVIAGNIAQEAMDIIAHTANAQEAPLRKARDWVDICSHAVGFRSQIVEICSKQTNYGQIELPLIGKFQTDNAAIVVAALECLNERSSIAISPQSVKAGLEQVVWPGRAQLLCEHPPIILDGAHNPDAAKALAQWLESIAKDQDLAMVASFLSDKAPAEFIKAFGPRLQRVWIISLATERAMPTAEIMRQIEHISHTTIASDLRSAIMEAKTWALERSGIVLITGSLYLVGAVLDQM
jgi:dihydrofolate synthase/folylpolyglutamate synthase